MDKKNKPIVIATVITIVIFGIVLFSARYIYLKSRVSDEALNTAGVESGIEDIIKNEHQPEEQDLIIETEAKEDESETDNQNGLAYEDRETVDSKGIYSDILRKYYMMVTDDWGEDEIYLYDIASVMAEGYKADEISYVYLDLNDNGVEELIIMPMGINGSRSIADNYIFALYSYDIDEKQIVPILLQESTALRDDGYYLYDDRVISQKSGGTGYQQMAYSKINEKNNLVLETAITYLSTIDDNGNNIEGWYESKNPKSIGLGPDEIESLFWSISDEEANDIQNSYEVPLNISRNTLSEIEVEFSFDDAQLNQIESNLEIPEDERRGISVELESPYLWEGTGLWMVPVQFYIDSEVVAGGDVCIDDVNEMRSVIQYGSF